jgi:hypothetical protein
MYHRLIAVLIFYDYFFKSRSQSSASGARIQVFLQIDGVIGTKEISVPARTQKQMKWAVAKQLKAWGFLHVSFCIQYGGKVLSGDSSLLADLGIVSGSTLHVKFYNRRGGVGGSKFILSDDLREKIKRTPSGRMRKYSITRRGLTEIFPKLLYKAKAERGFEKDDLTSHDCAALFQGKVWSNSPHYEGESLDDPKKEWKESSGWAVTEAQESLRFHPMEKFPTIFSANWPDRMISYTWANFFLIRHLPRFLAACEELVPPSAEWEATYWLDILANDQNSPDIKLYLDIADGLYSGAAYHFGFLCGGMLTRAWCNHEVVTRFLAGLKALGLWVEGQRDRTDTIIRGGELIGKGSPAFTLFVVVKGLTHWNKDLLADGSGNWGVDRFGTMQAFDAGDRREIQGRALRVFSNPAAFNFAMAVVRDGVILRHSTLHPVRPNA